MLYTVHIQTQTPLHPTTHPTARPSSHPFVLFPSYSKFLPTLLPRAPPRTPPLPMRRRTESGRHYSDSDDALSDPPSGRRHNKHKDADTDLGNALKDILDKGSLGQTPAGMGIDTPRASFDNLSILDPTNNHPASLPPPQTKPVHPLSSLPKTKNAHAPLSSLIQPRSDGRSDGSDSDSSLPSRPKLIDTTPFNSQDGSNFTPLQPPPQAPGTPVVGERAQ